MSKNGHSNPAYVSDHVDNVKQQSGNKYSLELAEKGGNNNNNKAAKDPDYNPYEHRDVPHPTT